MNLGFPVGPCRTMVDLCLGCLLDLAQHMLQLLCLVYFYSTKLQNCKFSLVDELLLENSEGTLIF
uniref:Putative 3 4-dihydroxy-2-butanone kinase isoform X5 n=1 Tax=Rhizophora mucronata TaxID=61149 RepID=A0A2P2LJY1_RHIMU